MEQQRERQILQNIVTTSRQQIQIQNEVIKANQQLPQIQQQIGVQSNNSCSKKNIFSFVLVFSIIFFSIVILLGIILEKNIYRRTKGYIHEGAIAIIHLPSGAQITSKDGWLRSDELANPIPFSFTSVYMSPVVSHNGRLLYERQIYKSIDYYHKDSEISISFDQNFNLTLRIPIDSAVNFAIGDLSMSNFEILKNVPELLKQALCKSSGSLLPSWEITVDMQISYDGIFDANSQSYKLLTEEDPYIHEQFQKINPMSELSVVKTLPKIVNANDSNQISKATFQTIKQLLNTIVSIVNQNKEVLQHQFGTLVHNTQNRGTKAAFDIIKGCNWIHSNILRCSEQVWNSGELKISNKDAEDPIQILQIVVSSK